MSLRIRATHRTLAPSEHRKSRTWQLACKLKTGYFRAKEMQETPQWQAMKLLSLFLSMANRSKMVIS